ncbi:MAG: hypothetical protein ACK55I_12785, partial [bacterium]
MHCLRDGDALGLQERAQVIIEVPGALVLAVGNKVAVAPAREGHQPVTWRVAAQGHLRRVPV